MTRPTRPRRPRPQLLLPPPRRRSRTPQPASWTPQAELLPPPPIDQQLARIAAELRRPEL